MENQNNYNILPVFLKTAIDNEIERLTSEELEAAKKRIDERKSQVIAGVILHVEKMIKVETMREELKITILTKEVN